MPPRRRNPPAALWLGAAAATTLAAGLTWAYFALRDVQPPRSTEEEREGTSGVAQGTSAPRPSARTGVKPSLTLSAASFPPAAIIESLSQHYTLHLLLPTTLTTPPTLPPSYSTDAPSFDPRRFIPHQTPEGVIHVVRALGGTVVFVRGGGVEWEVEREREEVGEMVELEEVVKGTKTFVRGVVVLLQGGDEEKAKSGEEVRRVKVVGGWEELKVALGVTG